MLRRVYYLFTVVVIDFSFKIVTKLCSGSSFTNPPIFLSSAKSFLHNFHSTKKRILKSLYMNDLPVIECIGPLIKAMRNGDWVILDELNLAPPDVLEALNRVSTVL